MAAYGKVPLSNGGFDMARPYPDPYAYGSLPQASGVSSVSLPGYQNGSALGLPYDEQPGSYLNVGSSTTPQVTSYHPIKGRQGTLMDVLVTFPYGTPPSNTQYFLMFGKRKCAASMGKLNQQGSVCQYIVKASAPPFYETGSHAAAVPVYLLMESDDGDSMFKVDVGSFHYFDATRQEIDGEDMARKRKRSVGSDAGEDHTINKRPSSHLLRQKDDLSYGYSTYNDYMQPNSPYTSIPQFSERSSYPMQQLPQRAVHHHQQQQYFSGSTASSPQDLRASPQVSAAWSPYSTVSSLMPSPSGNGQPNHTTNNNNVPATSRASTMPNLPSPGIGGGNPPLIRTSTLSQVVPQMASATPSSMTANNGYNHNHNPYMYTQKASLHLLGDLGAMTSNWTPSEMAASRRIVQFTRSQNGSVITASFRPYPCPDSSSPPLVGGSGTRGAGGASGGPGERKILISCIWWEGRQGHYVTSVDTIYLLEQLVAARFTVEEKNRIRRNLEGFRPLTVSKGQGGKASPLGNDKGKANGKGDMEAFFKLVMGFGEPKPRNIEKDVKVFEWSCLGLALRKIIGKYSASPSSTLPPPTLTPASSTGYASESGPPASSMAGHYNNNSGTVAVSPRTTMTRSISGSASGASGASYTVSSTINSGNGYGGSNRVTMPLPMSTPMLSPPMQRGYSYDRYDTTLTAPPSARTSWDFGNYLAGEYPGTATTTTGQGNATIAATTNGYGQRGSVTRLYTAAEIGEGFFGGNGGGGGGGGGTSSQQVAKAERDM